MLSSSASVISLPRSLYCILGKAGQEGQPSEGQPSETPPEQKPADDQPVNGDTNGQQDAWDKGTRIKL